MRPCIYLCLVVFLFVSGACDSPEIRLRNALGSIELKAKDGSQIILPNMETMVNDLLNLEKAKIAGEITQEEYERRVSEMKRRNAGVGQGQGNYGGSSGGGYSE